MTGIFGQLWGLLPGTGSGLEASAEFSLPRFSDRQVEAFVITRLVILNFKFLQC